MANKDLRAKVAEAERRWANRKRYIPPDLTYYLCYYRDLKTDKEICINAGYGLYGALQRLRQIHKLGVTDSADIYRIGYEYARLPTGEYEFLPNGSRKKDVKTSTYVMTFTGGPLTTTVRHYQELIINNNIDPFVCAHCGAPLESIAYGVQGANYCIDCSAQGLTKEWFDGIKPPTEKKPPYEQKKTQAFIQSAEVPANPKQMTIDDIM